MTSRLRHLLRDDSGVTLVEYGLIFSLLALGCIAVLLAISSAGSAAYNSSQNEFLDYNTRVPDQ